MRLRAQGPWGTRSGGFVLATLLVRRFRINRLVAPGMASFPHYPRPTESPKKVLVIWVFLPPPNRLLEESTMLSLRRQYFFPRPPI